MLTTLVSLFLTIFSALRAAPVYYSRILTLGNAFFASLDDGKAPTIDSPSGVITGTPVLHLPPSPARLTLPAGASSLLLGPSFALLAAVFTTTLVLTWVLWHLRAVTLALIDDGLNVQAGDSKTNYTVIDLSGVTYNGHMFTSDGKLAGPLTDTTTPLIPSPSVIALAASTSTVTSNTSPATPSSILVSREGLEVSAPASSRTTSPVLTPTAIRSPSLNRPVTAPVEFPPAVEEDDDAWDTWMNRRRRRPPRQPPPSAKVLSASRTRSPSVFSAERTSDTLSSITSAASTAPTSPPSSRRSSTAAFFPTKHNGSSFHSHRPRTPVPSIASYNKFSVLEVFEVEG